MDTYTREELERLAYLAVMTPGACALSILATEFGTHTRSSWVMAWRAMQGHLDASSLMTSVAAALDADPFYERWRDVNFRG